MPPPITISMAPEHADHLLTALAGNAATALPAPPSRLGPADLAALRPAMPSADVTFGVPNTVAAIQGPPPAVRISPPASIAPMTATAILPAAPSRMQAPSGETVGQSLITPIPAASTAPHGFWNTLGHGLKLAGLAAGTAFAPEAMTVIPGTPEHRMLQQDILERDLANQLAAGKMPGEIAQSTGLGRLQQAEGGIKEQEQAEGLGTSTAASAGSAAQTAASGAQEAASKATQAQAVTHAMLLALNQAGYGPDSAPAQLVNSLKMPDFPVTGQISDQLMQNWLDYGNKLTKLADLPGGIGQMFASQAQFARSMAEQIAVLGRAQNPDRVNAQAWLMAALGGPENYQKFEAELAAKRAAATQAAGLTPVTGDNGKPTFDSKGNIMRAGGFTPAPTGQTVSAAQAADTLTHMINDNIVPLVKQASDILGPVKGRETNISALIGNPSFKAEELMAQLSALGPMIGRMYGFRSGEYANLQSSVIGLKMTPDALQGYLKGLLEHASSVKSQGGMGEWKPPQGATPFGDGKTIKGYTLPNGKFVDISGKPWKE